MVDLGDRGMVGLEEKKLQSKKRRRARAVKEREKGFNSKNYPNQNNHQ
jgi:hypothetical protein